MPASLQPAAQPTHTTHTPTRTRPFPAQARPLLCLPLHCLFAAKTVLSTDIAARPSPRLRDSSFLSSPIWSARSHKDRPRPPNHARSFHSSRLSISHLAPRPFPFHPPARLDRFVHLFASYCQSCTRLDSLAHTRSVSAPQLYLPTSFHAGQADGRETLSILEYLADTRARAYPRRKESRHRPGPLLPRHLLHALPDLHLRFRGAAC